MRPSPLLEALKLTAELAAANQKITEKFIALISEKDAQIKLVLESKFQQYVQVLPAKAEKPEAPEDPQILTGVTEVSPATAEAEMERSTKAERDATKTLEQALEEEFPELFTEHESLVEKTAEEVPA